MRDDYPSEAPNYTNACIVMFGINITWIFTVIWAIWGLFVVMLVGYGINYAMTRLEERALARAAANRANPKARTRW